MVLRVLQNLGKIDQMYVSTYHICGITCICLPVSNWPLTVIVIAVSQKYDHMIPLINADRFVLLEGYQVIRISTLSNIEKLLANLLEVFRYFNRLEL